MSKKIYHRNDARPALIGMGLSAKRLLFMCLAQLERESSRNSVIIKFDSEKLFTITVKDYSEMCEIDYSASYRQLVKGVKELRGYVLEAEQGLVKKNSTDLPLDWIEPFTIAERGTGYSKGEGFVRIKFAKEMEPLISNLTGNFTGQFLLSAMQLPDGNAGKLYLILREWISSGFFVEKTISVGELKECLGVSNLKTYVLFNDFNNFFFKRAIKPLIKKTEFTSISMEILERRARKAYTVKISYSYDNKSSNQKDEIVDRVLGKFNPTRPKQEAKRKVNEETLFFNEVGRYLTKSMADLENLDWDTGLTPAETLKHLNK